jgi:sensor c-di-GMP phosphodiesterase-like protein
MIGKKASFAGSHDARKWEHARVSVKKKGRTRRVAKRRRIVNKVNYIEPYKSECNYVWKKVSGRVKPSASQGSVPKGHVIKWSWMRCVKFFFFIVIGLPFCSSVLLCSIGGNDLFHFTLAGR